MNRRALLALLPVLALPAALLAPGGAALAHPHEALTRERQGAVEQQVMAAREALRAAAASSDAAKLRAIYAADFTHTHASGKVDGRDARIASLLAGEPVVELARVEELTIRVAHADTAVLSGRSALPGDRGGEVRWMQVWVRAAGEWRVAASQATGVAPSA